MDHNKLVLIVAISLFAIALTSCASFLQSDKSSVENGADSLANAVSNESFIVASDTPKVEYLLDANGCGGSDNTVWCVSENKCVLPGKCNVAQTESVSEVQPLPTINTVDDSDGVANVTPVDEMSNSSDNISQ